MKQVVCLFLIFSITATVRAQATRDSIVATVNKLFTAMKTADTSLLRGCFSSTAILQTIQDDQGVIQIVDEKINDFIDFVGKETAGAADEQIVVESVKIDGPLAMVWASYKFYYKGKFSHCGVNSFQLTRLSEGWKIQYIIDTRRKENCR